MDQDRSAASPATVFYFVHFSVSSEPACLEFYWNISFNFQFNVATDIKVIQLDVTHYNECTFHISELKLHSSFFHSAFERNSNAYPVYLHFT